MIIEKNVKMTTVEMSLEGWLDTQSAPMLEEAAKAGFDKVKVIPGVTAALSGGCYQNTLLLDITKKALENRGFTVLTHSLIPPNDGGISIGQAFYGMNKLKDGGI